MPFKVYKSFLNPWKSLTFRFHPRKIADVNLKRIPKFLRPSTFKISLAVSLFFAAIIFFISGRDDMSGSWLYTPAGAEIQDIEFRERLALWHRNLARFFRTFEYRAFDQKIVTSPTKSVPPQVAIAAIDEKSVTEIGRWPWPRTVMAELIEKLNAKGAKVVVFDIVFSEPDQLGLYGKFNEILDRLDKIPKLNPELANVKAQIIALQGQWQLLAQGEGFSAEAREKINRLRETQGKAIDSLLSELSKQKEREADLQKFETFLRNERERVNADRILADAIAKADNVVLGYFFLTRAERLGLTEKQYNNFSTLENSKIKMVMNIASSGGADLKTASDILARHSHPFFGVKANIAEIAGENSFQGFFNTEADSDGIYRKAPTLIALNDSIYPSLSLQALHVYHAKMDSESEGIGPIIPYFMKGSPETGLEKIKSSAPLDIQCSSGGVVYYNWYGEKGSIPTFSIVDVLNGSISPDKIKDRIVLVGPTALAIADLRTTPFGEDFPGVEMQATLVGNFLENNYLTRPDVLFVLEAVLMLLLGTLLGVGVGKMRAVYGFLLTLGVITFFFLLDIKFIFPVWRIWVRSFWPLFGLFSVYLGVSLYRYIAEELARRVLKETFNVYVSPKVVDQMLESPDKFRLGGERKELTVFFSDIRDFTSISEKMPPEDLVHFLNDYLTPMTDIVLKYDGTLDKYIGDAIMGFWGAPLEQKDHAVRACRSALEMIETLKGLEVEWAKRNLPHLKIGIGINTGPMSVGNMGSRSRFSYTVMGDAVNLSSRLEGLCKEYGSLIIVGANTVRASGEGFIFRLLDKVRVKGKAVGEEIYELMGYRDGSQAQHHQSIAAAYASGLEAYWKRNWQEAEKCFQQTLSLKADDKSSLLMLSQIEIFKKQDPGISWDGIRTLTSK